MKTTFPVAENVNETLDILQAMYEMGNNQQVWRRPAGLALCRLIGWLRGSKKDTFSLPEMQKIIKQTATFHWCEDF